ncbi:MAG TPA: hypothetical protein VEG60_04915 [Candidatus Binatia bacterium]|nr:hypothetical protein [Candidatus Binatia bacterium]
MDIITKSERGKAATKAASPCLVTETQSSQNKNSKFGIQFFKFCPLCAFAMSHTEARKPGFSRLFVEALLAQALLFLSYEIAKGAISGWVSCDFTSCPIMRFEEYSA